VTTTPESINITTKDSPGEINEESQSNKPTASIEFYLFAPTIKWAALTGDFNGWQDTEMIKGDDGYFRTRIDLADGKYEYKFRVESNSPWQAGQRVLVADPQATAVNEANSDNSIRFIKNGQVITDEYQWKHDDKPLPPNPDVVIYELHVGDFAKDFQGLIKKLDYLQELGINAIELLPVPANPGNYSWGYMPRHFFALENSYGNSSDFKQLVDECHGRGIRVIVDLVLNHAEPESPLVHMDHNYWFMEKNPDQFQYGPKFDYLHYDEWRKFFPAREFGKLVTRYWVTEFHLDGIRFDGTFLIKNFDFLREAGQVARDAVPMKPLFVIAEHIPVDPSVIRPDMPFESLWNNNFLYPIGANLVEKDFGGWKVWDWERVKQALQPSLMGLNGPLGSIDYLANHDQHHFWHELELNGITGDKAFRKAKLGMTIEFTAVGLPLLWMGEEFGEFNDKSMDPRPLHFELLEHPKNKDLYEHTRRLIRLRQTNGALKTDKIEFLHLDEKNRVIAWKRWDEAGTVVAVVVNFNDQPLKGYVVPNFPKELNHEFIYDYPVQVNEQGNLLDDFGPSEAKIYQKI